MTVAPHFKTELTAFSYEQRRLILFIMIIYVSQKRY